MDNTGTPAARGKIGEQIYAQVNAMVSAEGITRTEAFQRIAIERDSRPGTVAANYYRIARLNDATSARPRGRRKAPAKNVDAVIAQATAALQELSALVREQNRELERLSDKVKQIEKLRALLSD
jgi:hypothetical protein